MNIKYKLLYLLTDNQIKQLYNILNNYNIMKWIGNGNLWSMEDINELIKYSKNDFDINYKNISYFYIAILNNNHVIGLAGIHPGFGKYKQSLQTLYLLDESYQGKGIAKQIRKRLKECSDIIFSKKNIYTITTNNNIKNIKSLKNDKKIDTFIFKNKSYFVYTF